MLVEPLVRKVKNGREAALDTCRTICQSSLTDRLIRTEGIDARLHAEREKEDHIPSSFHSMCRSASYVKDVCNGYNTLHLDCTTRCWLGVRIEEV